MVLAVAADFWASVAAAIPAEIQVAMAEAQVAVPADAAAVVVVEVVAAAKSATAAKSHFAIHHLGQSEIRAAR